MSGPKGMRVVYTRKPEWGLGHVLSDDGGTRVTVFFVGAGKRLLDTSIAELDLVTGSPGSNPILDVAARVNWQNAHHNLYVVELKPEVFSLETKFLEGNLGYIPGVKPCVYIGMTGLTPEERLQEHRNGNHSARFVRRYGVRLLPQLYKHFNPMPYDVAAVMEVELAKQLREQGYGVWQN